MLPWQESSAALSTRSCEPGGSGAGVAEIRHMQVCMLGFNSIGSSGFATPSDLPRFLGRTDVGFGKDDLPIECLIIAYVCDLN